MALFDITCEISDVSSEKLCYNACFVRRSEQKNRMKMVVPEVIETLDMIKFSVNGWDISQLKCLVCYKEVEML